MAWVAKGIKRWKKDKIGDMRMQLAVVKEVLLQLEATQEHRLLTGMELHLCRCLKARSTGLAAIEKSRIRQRSRLTYIRCGDANTKFSTLEPVHVGERITYIVCIRMGGLRLLMKKKKK